MVALPVHRSERVDHRAAGRPPSTYLVGGGHLAESRLLRQAPRVAPTGSETASNRVAQWPPTIGKYPVGAEKALWNWLYHRLMPLEELLSVVETLRGRIAAHGPALRQSEALTRYALIDPLLRGLGWDTADPSQVLVEYHSGGGSADYALVGSGWKAANHR